MAMQRTLQRRNSTGEHRKGQSRKEPLRQQYTLKGVEPETLDLVRTAAQQEGMRINSWIASRMREAAERSLRSATSDSVANEGTSTKTGLNDPSGGEIAEFMHEVASRFREIERDLHQLMRVQRSMMAELLEHRLETKFSSE